MRRNAAILPVFVTGASAGEGCPQKNPPEKSSGGSDRWQAHPQTTEDIRSMGRGRTDRYLFRRKLPLWPHDCVRCFRMSGAYGTACRTSTCEPAERLDQPRATPRPARNTTGSRDLRGRGVPPPTPAACPQDRSERERRQAFGLVPGGHTIVRAQPKCSVRMLTSGT